MLSFLYLAALGIGGPLLMAALDRFYRPKSTKIVDIRTTERIKR